MLIASRGLSRRAALTGAASVVATAATLPCQLQAREPLRAADTLGSLGAAKGLLVGASFAMHETEKPYGARYRELYLREMRSLTTELELKMPTVRPSRDIIEFAPADQSFDFASKHGLPVRGHTLVWNDNVPQWIKSLSTLDAGYHMDAHIETVLERFRGRAYAWDVVNEPIAPWDRLPGNLRAGPYLAAYGEDYIARSFRLARHFDPAAKLVLNEAFTETADDLGQAFRASFLNLVRRLKDRGAPIDAIGLQCHLKSGKPYDFPRFCAFVEQLAVLDFDIHITELDVDDSAYPRDLTARDLRVAALYRDFLTAVLPIPAVKVLTFWQLADHTSWLYYSDVEKRPSAERRPRPLPFDQNFIRKPAWSAIADALRAMPPR